MGDLFNVYKKDEHIGQGVIFTDNYIYIIWFYDKERTSLYKTINDIYEIENDYRIEFII